MPELIENTSGQKNRFLYLLLLIYALALVLGAFLIKREAFYALLAWQFFLHGSYFFIYRLRQGIPLMHIIWAALFMRLALAFVMPSLSEDVYRFVWDGQLIWQGDNPMLSTPDSYLASHDASSPSYSYFSTLHGLINHPQYFTVYPPLMQGVFWLSAAFNINSIDVSVVLIKLTLAITDGLTIYFLYKILKRLNLDPGYVLLYALHPLVIVEGSGNAHFEVMQAAFISGSIYFLLIKKINSSAVFWGLAIATKLLPLLLLPLWWVHLGFKKGFIFCCIAMAIAIASFIPFLSWNAIDTFSNSLDLFIRHFEFNASIYYLARAVGFYSKGYNMIATLGPLLLIFFLAVYAAILIKNRKPGFNHFVFLALCLFTLYFFFSTTVHPWYIITLLPFAVVSRSLFAFVWMSSAFLSYYAYSGTTVHENPWLIMLEYGLVAICMVMEWKKSKQISL